MDGIYYIATGPRHVAEAIRAAQTAREWMEAYPIALLTDQEVDRPVFDRVLRCSYPSNSYVDKIEGMLACPFDRAIFLDTDTHICGSIKGLFDLLTRFDLAVAHSSWRFSPPLVDGSVSDGA